ncbi:hypothetical protein SDC9_161455 [bioreactor metagenome]|uniref:Uncharacterized protein n=1 Tax=bioreactor metagenome TaxID=1076179 RepID=A0A645FLB7_9ZZZZ
MRILVCGMRQADQFDGSLGPRLELGLAFLAAEDALNRGVDVLEAGQPGQQAVVLEDYRPLRAGTGDFATVAEQHAGGRFGQAGDQVE